MNNFFTDDVPLKLPQLFYFSVSCLWWRPTLYVEWRNYAINYVVAYSNFLPTILKYFKIAEFMPNYQDMMNSTMGGGAASGAGSSSGFSNFTSVNVMLKGRVSIIRIFIRIINFYLINHIKM
jgi:hypothetical protein